MKKLASLLLALFMVVFLTTVAIAKEHKVQKGDSLSKIARKYKISGGWKTLWKANKKTIKNPNLIRIGQILTIPEKPKKALKKVTAPKKVVTKKISKPKKKAVKPTQAKKRWWSGLLPTHGNKPRKIKRLGQKPYRGNITKDLPKFLFRPEVEKILIEKISKKQSRQVLVPFGEVLEAMNYGSGGGMLYNIQLADDRYRSYKAVEYCADYSGYRYRLINLEVCGNWARSIRIPLPKKVPPKPIPTKIRKPRLERGELPTISVVDTKGEVALEHQPTIGAWTGQNELAKWWGIYGEYVIYFRKDNGFGGFQFGWSPGLGIFGMYSEGESLTSSYTWEEYNIGPQIAFKYIQDSWQFETKFRFVHEWIRGRNEESGYWVNQQGWKLGIYSELVANLDEDRLWKGLLIGEAWIPLDYDVSSSWRGQEVQNRFQVNVMLGLQRELNEEMSIRFLLGVFHQGWDDLTGIRAQAELRFKLGYSGDVLMVGPHVAFYPFGLSSQYLGIAASELTTWGGFIRLEAGPIVLDTLRQHRMNSVRLIKRSN